MRAANGDSSEWGITLAHLRVRTVALYSLEASFQSIAMRSFLLPPRWNLSSVVALAAHIFIRHFFSALEDKASSVLGVKGAFTLSLRLILLCPSLCMFTLSAGLLSVSPSFFLSGMPFKLSRPWWKWSERIAQKYCFYNRLLFSLLTEKEQRLSSCSCTTARMFTPFLYRDPQFWDGAWKTSQK